MKRYTTMILLVLVLVVAASGCTWTLKTGQFELDLELKEYARKPALDYVSSLLHKDTAPNEVDVDPDSDKDIALDEASTEPDTDTD